VVAVGLLLPQHRRHQRQPEEHGTEARGAIELSLAFALWLPRWRGWALLVGTIMHLSIGLFGKHPLELVPFQLAVFAVYVLFATDPVPADAAPVHTAA
jgi:hypothetical protein